MKRGIFVVFEGVDKVGKSTQTNMLIEYIKNDLKEKVQKFAFPGVSIFIYYYFSRSY
jgi:thymidylate kinase